MLILKSLPLVPIFITLEYLHKVYGRGRWRKLKGITDVKLPNGSIRRVELHWYEAHGIGRKDMKIKRYVD